MKNNYEERRSRYDKKKVKNDPKQKGIRKLITKRFLTVAFAFTLAVPSTLPLSAVDTQAASVKAPALTMKSGNYYGSAIKVKVQKPKKNYKYYYTTDGKTPTLKSKNLNSKGLTIKGNKTVKVIAYKGKRASKVSSYKYGVAKKYFTVTKQSGKYRKGTAITVTPYQRTGYTTYFNSAKLTKNKTIKLNKDSKLSIITKKGKKTVENVSYKYTIVGNPGVNIGGTKYTKGTVTLVKNKSYAFSMINTQTGSKYQAKLFTDKESVTLGKTIKATGNHTLIIYEDGKKKTEIKIKVKAQTNSKPDTATNTMPSTTTTAKPDNTTAATKPDDTCETEFEDDIYPVTPAINRVISNISLQGQEETKFTCQTYKGTNVERQNYLGDCAVTVKSYLVPTENGNFMRVQEDADKDGILIEYYDAAYHLQSSKLIPKEFPIWGAFYDLGNYYYVLTGQYNRLENDSVEVIRLTKYDKNWKKIKSCGLYGANTTVPFDAGSAKMASDGHNLIVRTCHEMYQTSDGVNHQANLTMEVNTDTMEVTDSFSKIANLGVGYVSHSLNQFVGIDQGKVVAVDQGDAYPRSIVLTKSSKDVADGAISSFCQNSELMKFPGQTGDCARTSSGAFEISSSTYLVAGSSEYCNNKGNRDVFVFVVDKNNIDQVQMKKYTACNGTEEYASTPHLIALGNDTYMLMWSLKDVVYYTKIDAQGNMLGKIYNMPGNLSDCVPKISNNKLVWYTWNEGTISFYEISLNDYNINKTYVIKNGHTYRATGEMQDEKAVLKCETCGDKNTMHVVFGFAKCISFDGEVYHGGWMPKDSYQSGTQLKYWIDTQIIEYDGYYNAEMEVISSNPSVISVEMTEDNFGTITFRKPGKAVLTFRPKYNPSLKETYTISVK